jgi:hypothetical protein
MGTQTRSSEKKKLIRLTYLNLTYINPTSSNLTLFVVVKSKAVPLHAMEALGGRGV